jgi:hypothetical protein
LTGPLYGGTRKAFIGKPDDAPAALLTGLDKPLAARAANMAGVKGVEKRLFQLLFVCGCRFPWSAVSPERDAR